MTKRVTTDQQVFLNQIFYKGPWDWRGLASRCAKHDEVLRKTGAA